MGLKWNEMTEDLRASIESVLIKNSGPIDPTDVSRLWRACLGMDYKWSEQKEVAESLFSMFRIAFSNEHSFQRNSQTHFTLCIRGMAEAGVKWVGLPEEVQLAIFQGIENRSPVRFGTDELSRLFYG
jgi:hypothetical protein